MNTARPFIAHRYDQLAATARRIQRHFEEQSRAPIAQGTSSADQIGQDLRVAKAIAAEWDSIAEYRPEPGWLRDPRAGGAFPGERQALLQAMLIRAQSLAPQMVEAIESLIWWETAQPSARILVEMTLELRARARAKLNPQPKDRAA
jgi:hypothetical protein